MGIPEQRVRQHQSAAACEWMRSGLTGLNLASLHDQSRQGRSLVVSTHQMSQTEDNEILRDLRMTPIATVLPGAAYPGLMSIGKDAGLRHLRLNGSSNSR
jgi:hypothetical protein